MQIQLTKIDLPAKCKVIQAGTVSNGSFIFLYIKHNPLNAYVPHINLQYLHHFDKEGKSLKVYPIKEHIYQFVMARDTVILPLFKRNYLLIINLSIQQQFWIPFTFINSHQPPHVFWFSQTKLLCVKEVKPRLPKDTKEDNIFVKYWFTTSVDPLFCLEYHLNSKGPNNEEKLLPRIQKANNHSLIAFFQAKNNTIILHDIVSQGGKTQSRVKSIQSDIMGQKLNLFSCWQIMNNYMAFIPLKGCGFEKIKILQINSGKERSLQFPLLNGQPSEGELFLNPAYLKNFICLKQQDFPRIKQHMTPQRVLNINKIVKDNQMQVEEGSSKEKEVTRLVRVCDFQDSIAVLTTYNQETGTTIVKKMKPALSKDIYMHFLLHLNEDLDDDLLLDAMAILDCI